jgi:hypothetical protein
MSKTTLYLAIPIALCIGAIGIYNWKHEEWIVIPTAREPLQAKLRDPGSAQFRNERITRIGVLCGEVNSKDEMGGYVGFKKYFIHGAGNYVEGIGSLDEETHEELIERLGRETSILKSFIEIAKTNPEIKMPSGDRIAEMAAEQLQVERWQTACEA